MGQSTISLLNPYSVPETIAGAGWGYDLDTKQDSVDNLTGGTQENR